MRVPKQPGRGGKAGGRGLPGPSGLDDSYGDYGVFKRREMKGRAADPGDSARLSRAPVPPPDSLAISAGMFYPVKRNLRSPPQKAFKVSGGGAISHYVHNSKGDKP